MSEDSQAVGAPVQPSVRQHCSHCGFPLPASDSGLRHYGTHTAHQESECLRLLHAEIERLRVGHERYETARRMNPRQWSDAWKLNLSTGKGFDQIVDDLRPFMRPNAALTEQQQRG